MEDALAHLVDRQPLDPLEFDLFAHDDAPIRVLVIDDDRRTLDVIDAVLGRAGFVVIRHDTPFGSAHVIRTVRPDVVLMDVEMNDLAGETVVSHLRRGLWAGGAAPETEFILYSGMATWPLNRLSDRVGALGSIEKSGNFDHFLSMFTLLLHRSPRLSGRLQSAFLRGLGHG